MTALKPIWFFGSYTAIQQNPKHSQSQSTYCATLGKILKFVGKIAFAFFLPVSVPYAAYYLFKTYKNRKIEVSQELRKEVINGLADIWLYGRTMSFPNDAFCNAFIQRFNVLQHVGSGQCKAAFRDGRGNVAKITFFMREGIIHNMNLHFCLKELGFFFENPRISNIPQDITIYLSSSIDKESVLKTHKQFIEKHSVTIKVIEVFNSDIGGFVAWKEQAYTHNVFDFMEKVVGKNGSLESNDIRILSSLEAFWTGIKNEMDSGKQYMVSDLQEKNIGIFPSGLTIRIADAQPSDTPFQSEEVSKLIAKYQSFLQGYR